MKNIIYTLICCCTLMNVQGQSEEIKKIIRSETNQKKLTEMAASEQKRAKENYERALKLAKEKKWPLEIKGEDGSVAVLVGVDLKDNPLYRAVNDVKNLESATFIKTNILNQAPYNLLGNNYLIGLWDGGRVFNNHEQFSGLTKVRNVSNLANNSHATLVAGTLAGDGIGNSGVTPQSSNGKGMAPNANLISYDFNNSINILPQLVNEYQNVGLLVSNHSYGIPSGWNGNNWFGNDSQTKSYLFGNYSFENQRVDNFLTEMPFHLMVVSAGNDRDDLPTYPYFINGRTESSFPRDNDGGPDGFDCISGGSKISKNVLTVGAVDRSKNMSNFSGWGPTDDGRIKPDIVSDGVNVLSAYFNEGNPTILNAYAPGYGTSMAAPTVTGSSLLLQERYISNNRRPMRAPSLKAVLLHTAEDLGNPGPDYKFGWGLIDSEKAVKVIDKENGALIIEDGFKVNENTIDYTFEIPKNTSELKVTLAYNDLGGTAHDGQLDNREKNLVRDIDIKVIDPTGTPFYPFVLDPTNPNSVATKGNNITDNVEQVLVLNPQTRFTRTLRNGISVMNNYKLRVSVKNKPRGETLDFSLVITGAKNLYKLEVLPASGVPNRKQQF